MKSSSKVKLLSKVWIAPFLLFFFFISLILPASIFSQELHPLPNLNGPVVDMTDTLSATSIRSISDNILALQKEKGSQIQVVVVYTTKPEEIEQYSIRLADEWKIGRKGVDDGVILLVAKQDRKLRIEVGYGLEGVIPDAIARRIISEVITPRFKEGDFEQGISDGVDTISKLIQGEELPPPSATDQYEFEDNSRILQNLSTFQSFLGLIGIAVGFIFMFNEKFLYSWSSIATFFFVSGLFGNIGFLSLIIFSLVGAFFVFIFLLGILHGDSGGGSSSGGGWSSSSGSSSGGGWSGGGGSFGGGGSSGSW